MPNIYLDPFLFACPHPDAGLNEFEQYIRDIISWRDIREATWVPVYIPASTYEALANTNSYPLWGPLKFAINTLGIVDVQAKDVMELVNGLLTKLPTVEDKINVRAVTTRNVSVNPKSHLEHRHITFVEQYRYLLILICLMCHFEKLRQTDQLVITRRLTEAPHSVGVTGEVTHLESSGTERAIAIGLPYQAEGTFNSCCTTREIYHCLDPVAVWLNGHAEEAYRVAISIHVYQRSGLDPTSAPWSIGPRFLETAWELGFYDQEPKARMLLRACAETILKADLQHTHALRRGPGPNEPQKKRGEDTAWRRDIDHEFHLHYWETAYGPELASVVTHSDTSIPES